MPATVFAVREKTKGGISVFKRTATTKSIATSGIIAAMYVVLTFIANAFGLANGVIQVRLSEALTILPCFTSAAIPGLTVGCVLANILTYCEPMDVALGSLATLIGAMGTCMLKDKPLLAWIPPVASNAIIVPFVLRYAYHMTDAWWFMVLTVGAGEIITCGVLGLLLYKSLKRVPSLFSET